MRRKDREITDFHKMMQIVAACDCCRLGLVDGEEAYIVPMNFGYEIADGQLTLYFHCAAEGRRLELLPRQSTVTFEMDTKHGLVTGSTGCKYSWLYQCVMGTGAVTLLSDREEKARGLETILAHYTDRTQWEFPDETLSRTVVFRLDVKSWSCKEHS